MAGERDCNESVGPLIGDQALLRRVFAAGPELVGRPELLKVPRKSKLAFTLDRALSPEECAALIEAAERIGFGPAGIGGERQVVDTSQRSSYRVISDDEGLAELLWSRIRAHVPVVWAGRRVLGLNERLRFLRYTAGQHFGPHYDGTFERKGTWNRSFLTVQLYLNGSAEMQGGATRFHGGLSEDGAEHADVDCLPKQGRALIFEHHILHEGLRVLEGVKYAMRTDVEYGPPSLLAGLQAAVGFGGTPVENQRRFAQVLAAALVAGLGAAASMLF